MIGGTLDILKIILTIKPVSKWLEPTKLRTQQIDAFENAPKCSLKLMLDIHCCHWKWQLFQDRFQSFWYK